MSRRYLTTRLVSQPHPLQNNSPEWAVMSIFSKKRRQRKIRISWKTIIWLTLTFFFLEPTMWLHGWSSTWHCVTNPMRKPTSFVFSITANNFVQKRHTSTKLHDLFPKKLMWPDCKIEVEFQYSRCRFQKPEVVISQPRIEISKFVCF